MSNEEMYRRLNIVYTPQEMKNFCIIYAQMCDILYREDDTRPSEYEYDRNWYLEKYNDLCEYEENKS